MAERDRLGEDFIRQQGEGAPRELQMIDELSGGFEDIGEISSARDRVIRATNLCQSAGPRLGGTGIMLKEIKPSRHGEPIRCKAAAHELSMSCRIDRERGLLRRSEEHTSELQSHHDLVCR